MFVEIRESGKKRKYYLVHSYREDGKVKRISRYLGSNLTENKLSELRRQAERHILDEVKEKSMLDFELTKEQIEQFKKLEKPIEVSHLQTLNWKKFTEDFTYNTNAIEGSTVALPDVRGLLRGEEKPRDVDEKETVNVAKAVEHMRTNKEKISVSFLQKIHAICFKGTKSYAGKLKNVNVIIKDGGGNIIHQGAPAREVRTLLENLCSWYNKHKNKYPPLLLATVMHNEFEKIHPFQDGNARVGRLLLNYVLFRHKYPPINIRLADRQRYYKCLQEYDDKNDIKLTIKFLISQYKKQGVYKS